ncbi:MAG: hypothetical protein JKX76_01820 [Colwellia sp.]|nr:hypothetical protein [Colwellia sp.]
MEELAIPKLLPHISNVTWNEAYDKIKSVRDFEQTNTTVHGDTISDIIDSTTKVTINLFFNFCESYFGHSLREWWYSSPNLYLIYQNNNNKYFILSDGTKSSKIIFNPLNNSKGYWIETIKDGCCQSFLNISLNEIHIHRSIELI